jgi:hypothetical protein
MYANQDRAASAAILSDGNYATAQMRSLNAVNAQCPTRSARQGGFMANFSKFMKDPLGQ